MVNGFPRLLPGSFTFQSPKSNEYNCIAWAAGQDSVWWWPVPENHYYWPPDIPRTDTVESFRLAFQSLGYEECQDACLETGFEKVSIYARSDGKPTHAAKQMQNGKWTSKLGSAEDIEHEDPETLTGSVYGQPVIFMRRRIQAND